MSVVVRSKWAIARYGVPIAVGLAVVGLLALGGAWNTYANPPTEAVTDTVDREQFATEMGTSAVATGQTGLYAQGDRLEDESVYFFNATRTVTILINTSVPGDETVAVDKRLELQHRASRNGESFWESRRVLAAADENVSDGDVSMAAETDMAAVRETVTERRSEIGSVGTFRSELVLQVDYESANNSDSFTERTPVVLTDRAFWFEDSLAANRSHSTDRTRTVTGSRAWGAILGFGGLSVLAFGLAAGLVAITTRGIDVSTIETELARTRYDEWISRGEIPTKTEKQYIRIDTLEDLVDIAIDSNKRVIYDTDYDAYGVVDGDIVYYYADGEAEFVQWLDI